MSVASITGTNQFTPNLNGIENSGKSKKPHKSTSTNAPTNVQDDLTLSANQNPKSNQNHISYIDNSTTNNDNSTTINNYYTNYYNNDTTPSDGSNTGTNNTINYYSQEQDLSSFNDRLDALTKELDDLGNAVAKFEKLVLDFEGRIGQFEQGEGPVIRGQFQVDGLSFNNINFALKFAKQGFNLVDILQTVGGSETSTGLGNISSSLTRSLESLKSQSQNLEGLFSNNLGTALNQAV